MRCVEIDLVEVLLGVFRCVERLIVDCEVLRVGLCEIPLDEVPETLRRPELLTLGV